jgi:hypothetical protein
MERTESDHREILRPGGESYMVLCKWETLSRTKAEAFLASTIRNREAITHLLLAHGIR